MSPAGDKLWGCLAAFDSPERLLAAAQAAHAAGYRQLEAYTPFPVDGLEEALGRSEHSWVPWLMLLGAILGGIFGYWIQWYTAVVDFPINVGGRPLNSWPASSAGWRCAACRSRITRSSMPPASI